MSEMQGMVESMELLEIDERQKTRGYVRMYPSKDGWNTSFEHYDYEVIAKTPRGTFIVKAPRADE